MKPLARALGTALSLGALAYTPETRAEVSARLEWRVPPPDGCVDAQKLESTVEARLGRAVFTGSPESVLIRAEFAEDAGRKTVRLEVLSPTHQPLGDRELSATSCDDLGASLPVVIAVLLDLALQEHSSHRAEEVLVDAREPPRPPRAPRANPSARVEVAAAVLAEVLGGLQPGLAGGVGLEASVSPVRPLWLVAWGDLLFPTSTQGSPSVSLQSGSIGGGLCADTDRGRRLSVGVCAGGAARLLSVHRSDLGPSSADTRWLPEARLFARVSYHLFAQVFARVDAGAVIPLERPHYELNDETGLRVELFRPSWGGIGQLGISIAFR